MKPGPNVGLFTIPVEVTQDDIDRARPTAMRCPLARALRRTTKVRPIAVFGDTYQAGEWEWPTFPAAQKFIHAFDNGEPVKPGTFYVLGPAR